MKKLRFSGRALGLCAAAILLGAASNWASAGIPDADTGAFHGCVINKTGVLRVIDPSTGATCKAGETPITWGERAADEDEMAYEGAAPAADGSDLPRLLVMPGEPTGNDPFPVFQFQPGSIVGVHQDQSVTWDLVDPTAVSNDRDFTGKTGRTLTIVAEFSADLPLVPGQPPAPSLGGYLASLQSKATPVGAVDPEPPDLLFLWGPPQIGTFFTGVMTDLDIVHTEMTHSGFITGARVTLTLAEIGFATLPTNSFAPDTQVLMADGSTQAIADVQAGDLVMAADGPARVTGSIVGDGVKRLVDIEIGGAVVTATDEHRFWVDGAGWVAAHDLAAGDALRLADGNTVAVDAARARTASQAVVNLSVASAHSFFVVAGDAPVLVADGG